MAKIYRLLKGDSLVDGVLDIAKGERVRTGSVQGVGGVDTLRLAYFNRDAKKYEEHDYREFLEVASLVGNVTLKDGKPFLHIHGTFGRRDMSAIAGHVISATVSPTLEVVVIPTRNTALRRFDDETGLNLIYRTSDSPR